MRKQSPSSNYQFKKSISLPEIPFSSTSRDRKPSKPVEYVHETELYPPENFAMVMPGVYRSGFPKKQNFEFLKKLKIKTILYGVRKNINH